VVLLALVHVAGAAAEKPFRVGVYIYAYRMAEAAQDENTPIGEFVDRHFRILSENGVNAVYLGGTGPTTLDDYLPPAGKYGIVLIPQLDCAYFQGPKWTDRDLAAYAKRAGEVIVKYQHRPEILAWSVKEEVAHSWVNGLARYYTMILEHAPEAKFNLIHSNIHAARDLPEPNPAIVGTDRYGFWWEFSGGGYLASPAYALKWTRVQAGTFYPEAARRGADYMLVVTQGGMTSIRSANTLCKTPQEMSYPRTPEERQQLHERVLAYANDNRMGWRKVTTDQGDSYAVWKYYRLPENCLKACAWSSVLEGAKLFFVWSYSPPTKALLALGNIEKQATSAPTKKNVVWWTLAGRPGMPNRHLPELAELSREIRAYEKIITKMLKVQGLTVQTEPNYTFGQAFRLPTRPGIVLVLHNANVGTWPANSRYFFRPTDKISINDEGDLVGYVPKREPLPVRFTCSEELTRAAGKADGVFDLATGKEIDKVDGEYTVPVRPGSGVLLFLGTREQALQLQKSVAP